MGMYNLKQFAGNRIELLKVSMIAILTVMLFATASLKADTKGTVKGLVTDAETKKPLIGATVSIPELRLGAITDDKGKFSFEAPAGTHIVQIRYVGYEVTKRKLLVRAGETTKFDLALSGTDVMTNEVVVTGLTGEVDKRKLGNMVSNVGGNEIAKTVSSSAVDAIAGRVPGVQVTKNSGTPGSGTFITMRGRRTIEGSSEPLYVVDGIIMDNSSLYDGSGTKQFSNRAVDINPSDIEDMTILKGASAAAIYGSQAGNGVVIITTKKGKLTSFDKPASITYSSSYGMDQKTGTVPTQTTFGQRTPYKPYKAGSTDSWSTTPLAAGTTVYNQADVPFRTGQNTENTLTISGGVPQFDYLLSGTYNNTSGYVIGSEYQRSSIRGNVGAQILPGVTIQNNTNFISINNDLPQDGSNTSGIMLGALRTPPEFDNTNYLEADKVTQRKFASYDNPFWSQHFNTYNSKIDRFLNSTDIKYKPVDWVTLKAGLGIDRYEYINSEKLAVGSRASSNLGSLDYSRYTSKNTNLDLTATLVNKWADDAIATTFVFGSQTLWNTYSVLAGSSTNILPFYDMISAGSTKDAGSSLYEYMKVGVFGQLTTSFYDRYNVTLAIRRDGSSTFGASQKYHWYPKASISYNISDEDFWKGIKDVVNTAKLRATYGTAGSPSLPGTYATNYLYGTAGFFDPWGRGTTASRNGYIGIKPGGGSSDSYVVAGSEDIRPENTEEIEFGFDFGILNNFITFEATYYSQNITDMILSIDVASSTGYDKQLLNGAAMWNKGFEFIMNANLIKTPDFSWTTSFNYSQNKNEVTDLLGVESQSLNGGFTGIQNMAVKGKPLGIFMGYGWLRDEAGNIQYSTWDAAKKEVMGDDWGMNLVGAPRQASDMVTIGDPNPDFQFGWRNEFTVMKDLTFSFLFEGVYGFDVWNGTKGALMNFGTAKVTEDRNETWVNDAGQTVMDYSDAANPVAATKLNYYRYYANGFYINEPWVEDGSFIKLREITVEYRWDGLKPWNISNVTFTASARNLLTITKYTGYDPEVNTFSLAEGRGFDYFTLPQVKSFRFGISVNY
jgi:TonB-linked SusC/RagA family outer membrane protein